MHPLIGVLLREPQLLVTHAKAYGELLLQELSQANVQWHQRVLWQLASLCSVVVACLLLGVASMLWAVTPPELIRAPWVLIVLPMVFVGIAVGCLVVAKRRYTRVIFAQTRQQFQADVALLGKSDSA
jgi:cytochrome c-type biogenesis protein CcmH/NrfF